LIVRPAWLQARWRLFGIIWTTFLHTALYLEHPYKKLFDGRIAAARGTFGICATHERLYLHWDLEAVLGLWRRSITAAEPVADDCRRRDPEVPSRQGNSRMPTRPSFGHAGWEADIRVRVASVMPRPQEVYRVYCEVGKLLG
jgi:hypothetical protein